MKRLKPSWPKHRHALKAWSPKKQLTQRIESSQADIAQGQSDLNAFREKLSKERAAKESGIARADALAHQLESVKTDFEQAITALKSEHQYRVEGMQVTLAAQECAFRQEVDKATERLEGV